MCKSFLLPCMAFHVGCHQGAWLRCRVAPNLIYYNFGILKGPGSQRDMYIKLAFVKMDLKMLQGHIRSLEIWCIWMYVISCNSTIILPHTSKNNQINFSDSLREETELHKALYLCQNYYAKWNVLFLAYMCVYVYAYVSLLKPNSFFFAILSHISK